MEPFAARHAAEAAVLRLAARGGDHGPIVGVAELRPQPHDPRIGFLRLFVSPENRRKAQDPLC
ncbi:GNAT family N-acetyltransferase [Nonomuraea turcica]|uniref:GNAT family N-acetyltransferase n=1 Tax=Nonomuraea sp. G32 TaxID=3067274 RepID=UPI00273B8D32|nr:GNAT family N-acetyltransferase [Nonomuraea sp. G32]MDP4507166.1 GNAT family N-acetyltransferase [Nonomuraea sp. G32]